MTTLDVHCATIWLIAKRIEDPAITASSRLQLEVICVALGKTVCRCAELENLAAQICIGC
jgi:hypothetical protein